ncbi:MAG: flagella basal body P-ring formation protein FlgA [Armatimonadetes bacterium]|nr:flagella basal body P-ring formation protein FlgA [Armatimonadota bacterium]
MKPLLALTLAVLAPPALGAGGAAAPVHVALKPAASVSPDAGDFFSLGSVADLTGGDPALRARLAKVTVGRAPLPGDVRHLTRGDLALKLRQAGFHPGKDAVVEGADHADLTASSPAPPESGAGGASPSVSAKTNPLLVHRGDPVTIRIDDGDLAITAKGTARDNGAAGDAIRVHRENCVTDLTVTVLDAQTVQLEP